MAMRSGGASELFLRGGPHIVATPLDNEYQEAHEGDRVIVPEPQPRPSTLNPLRSNPRRNKAGMSGQRSNQEEQKNDDNDDHQTRPSKRKFMESPAALKDKSCQKKGKGRPRKQLAFSSSSANEDEEDENNASKSPLSRMKNKDRQQSKTKNQIGKNILSFPEAAKFSHDNLPIDPYSHNTPYVYLKLFISDTFVEKMVKETKRYAAKHNNLAFQAKVDDSLIRASHAVMFMTGYLKPSYRRMYWKRSEDTANMMAKKAMSRNTFDDVMRFTHFANSDRPKDDPF